MDSIKPGDVSAVPEGTFSYQHDVAIVDAFWQEIGEANNTKWVVEGTLDMVGTNPDNPDEDKNSPLPSIHCHSDRAMPAHLT